MDPTQLASSEASQPNFQDYTGRNKMSQHLGLDLGTYCIWEQPRLRGACTSDHSHLSLADCIDIIWKRMKA